MLDILDQKYGRDRKQRKINYLDEFFQVERGGEETVQDYDGPEVSIGWNEGNGKSIKGVY